MRQVILVQDATGWGQGLTDTAVSFHRSLPAAAAHSGRSRGTAMNRNTERRQ